MDERVEVSYGLAENEDERLKQMVRILSDGVWAYLKRRGLSTTTGSPNATHRAGTGTGLGRGEDS
jgi:hypothetical protein